MNESKESEWNFSLFCLEGSQGLLQQFSVMGNFASRVHLAISEDIFGCHQLRSWEGATGIYWIEARDAAKYPTMFRTIPAQQMRKLRLREVKQVP